MTDFFSYYFGPLDKGACVYFLIITVLFFVMLLFAILGEVMYVLRNFKSLNMRMFTAGLLLIFNLFIAYFVNRLLYTMCNKSLA
jgi:hypothetical protein